MEWLRSAMPIFGTIHPYKEGHMPIFGESRDPQWVERPDDVMTASVWRLYGVLCAVRGS